MMYTLDLWGNMIFFKHLVLYVKAQFTWWCCASNYVVEVRVRTLLGHDRSA